MCTGAEVHVEVSSIKEKLIKEAIKKMKEAGVDDKTVNDVVLQMRRK